jgi:hypothetical protein
LVSATATTGTSNSRPSNRRSQTSATISGSVRGCVSARTTGPTASTALRVSTRRQKASSSSKTLISKGSAGSSNNIITAAA